MTTRKVAIVGTGINGMGCGLSLLRTSLPNLKVVAFQDREQNDTTTAGCAGLMFVNYTQTEVNTAVQWANETRKFIQKEKSVYGMNSTGIYPIGVVLLSAKEKIDVSPYIKTLDFYRELSSCEMLDFPNYKHGLQTQSFIIEGNTMQDHLTKRFLEMGGEIVNRSIQNFDELADEGFEMIINCTGLGASKLCNDSNVFPCRGHILRTDAQYIRNCYFDMDEPTYIIPRKDFVILGGFTQDNNTDLKIHCEDTQDILNRVSKIFPDLKNCNILSEWVGLRPSRVGGVRLELEDRNSYKIFHNYGHGGCGMTMFWGPAKFIAESITEIFKS